MTTRLRQVGPDVEVPDQTIPPAKTPAIDQAALNLLVLSLKSLSQRAVIALAGLTTLLMAASVFFLAYLILTLGPTIHQLVGLGLYGIFILLTQRHGRG